jgi:hypothetical protein
MFLLIFVLRNSLNVLSIFSSVIDHLGKSATLFDQLVRLADLYYFSSMHNYDLVVIGNCVQPMSDCNDSRIFKFGFKNVLNQFVSPHIHVRCSLVQN